ncbi:MAG: hypothetical protein O7G85_12890 [Planctomycetota bacterium]|nr:hypothetical protein [Planctomycetota bacterium]
MNIFSLGEFLMTILIGLYAIFAFALVYVACVDRGPLDRWFRHGTDPSTVAKGKSKDKSKGKAGIKAEDQAGDKVNGKSDDKKEPLRVQVSTALLILSALVAGLAAEIGSDRLASEIWLQFPILSSEYSNRANVLAKKEYWFFGKRSLTSLGKNVRDLGLFAPFGGPDGADVQSSLDHNDTIEDFEAFNNSASDLYFHSKNIVTREKTYNDELQNIQTLIDFARSFTGVSLFMVLIVFFLQWTFPSKRLYRLSIDFGSRDPCPFVKRRFWARFLLVLVTLFVFWAGRFVFVSLEQDYNKRSFGYFASLVRQGILHVPAPGTRGASARLSATWTSETQLPGISGMAPWRPNRFLVVHDLKDLDEGARLGMVQVHWDTTGRSVLSYTPVELHLPECARLPSDLESLCRNPGKQDEFFAAESGHYDPTKPGRFFHLRIVPAADGSVSAEVVDVFELPEQSDGSVGLSARNPQNPNQPWDQVEGMVGFRDSTGDLIIVLGERRTGDVLRAKLTDQGLTDVMRFYPSSIRPGFDRQIAALLYEPARQRLLAVATNDPENRGAGDQFGPFSSIVYELAMIDQNGTPTFTAPDSFLWKIDGLKVEAIATTCYEDAPYCVGTDDEALQGSWRLLATPQ